MFNYFESIALTEAFLKFIKHKQKAKIAGNTFFNTVYRFK